jgi:hypothetical protein
MPNTSTPITKAERDFMVGVSLAVAIIAGSLWFIWGCL